MDWRSLGSRMIVGSGFSFGDRFSCISFDYEVDKSPDVKFYRVCDWEEACFGSCADND